MALWDKLMGEFVDVIEWIDDTQDTLVYRFERYGNEIKNGAKLTVREGQMAIMVHEGELADHPRRRARPLRSHLGRLRRHDR